MSFNFSTAGRIVFGDGAADQLRDEVKKFGERAFVITGNHTNAEESPLKELCELAGLEIWRSSGEPSVEGVRAAVAAARQAKPDVIVALGGGSAIDSAKALICTTATGRFTDLLPVLQQAAQLPPALHKHLIAIPTTAGTGSEVTPWATIWDQAAGQKGCGFHIITLNNHDDCPHSNGHATGGNRRSRIGCGSMTFLAQGRSGARRCGDGVVTARRGGDRKSVV